MLSKTRELRRNIFLTSDVGVVHLTSSLWNADPMARGLIYRTFHIFESKTYLARRTGWISIVFHVICSFFLAGVPTQEKIIQEGNSSREAERVHHHQFGSSTPINTKHS